VEYNMRLCKKTFRIASLAFIILMLASGTILAAYSYYATVQVQETGGNSYSYLPVIADIDNDYLSDEGYISLTGLDTRILSGSTELEHLVADDKVLFAIPSVGANSTGNYRYTLGNSLADDFPIIVGYDTGVNGYVTITDVDALDGGAGGMDTFEIEQKGYVNTASGADKNLVYKEVAFLTYISDSDEITSKMYGDFPTVESTTSSSENADVVNHTVDLPAGVASDDLIIILFACDSNPTVTFPNEGVDWIQLHETNNGTACTMGTWYRIADGGEGANITVVTTNAQESAHCSYRISGYQGVPEIGTPATGDTNNPDPPSCTPSWGAIDTLWIAGAGVDHDDEISTGPANYTDFFEVDSGGAGGSHCGTARRELNAVSEDPGTFDIDGAENRDWIATTIAVSPQVVSTTVTGVSSGERIVKTTADGTDLTLSVTDYSNVHLGNSPQSTALDGASVTNNGNNWVLNQNNVLPYIEYYKHTVAGTLIAWYQPISMIVGTNLDDREGTDAGETGTAEEDGIITWGANPANLSATVGSLISSSQPSVSPAGEEEAIDIVPGGEVPITDGVVNTAKLEDNPLYPIVQVVSEYTEYTDEQIWFIGATIIILIGMGISAVKVPSHLLLAGTVGLVLAGFFAAMEIYQWWMMLIFGFMFLMSILMERKPVL